MRSCNLPPTYLPFFVFQEGISSAPFFTFFRRDFFSPLFWSRGVQQGLSKGCEVLQPVTYIGGALYSPRFTFFRREFLSPLFWSSKGCEALQPASYILAIFCFSGGPLYSPLFYLFQEAFLQPPFCGFGTSNLVPHSHFWVWDVHAVIVAPFLRFF